MLQIINKKSVVALIVVAAAVSITSEKAIALTYNGGQIVWEFLNGTYSSGYDSNGRPTNIIAAPVPVTQDFLTRLSAALPERTNVLSTNPDYIASDEQANIKLKEAGEVFVTFLHEGAGYRNSFGYFKYDPASPPTDVSQVQEKVVFPNCSFQGSGGGMIAGDTIKIGSFNAGDAIGFFVAANGWSSSTGVKTTISQSLIHHSIRALNNEADPLLRAHNVVLYDDQSGLTALGFEDVPRDNPGCDQDFNDVIVLITTNPPSALDNSQLTVLPEAIDTDGDGVLDANDDFPNDPERAFKVYYPSKDQRGTLAFEDLWPQKGDYDMNDLVVRYQYTTVIDANQRVKDVYGEYQITARGALYQNGFGLLIENQSVSNLSVATKFHGTNAPENLVVENASQDLVVRVFDNANQLAPPSTGYRFFNTEENAPEEVSSAVSIQLTFATAQPLAVNAPFNPFLFYSANHAHEIHLPDFKPSSLADMSLFRTSDDDSSAGIGRWYRTENNLPFALDIPYEFEHPLERTPINEAFPEFANWVQSGGATNVDWYARPTLNKLFRRP